MITKKDIIRIEAASKEYSKRIRIQSEKDGFFFPETKYKISELAFIEGAQYEFELNDTWIKVEDRLPELNEPLMFWDDKKGCKVVGIENYKAIVLAYNEELGIFKAELNKTTGWSEISSISCKGSVKPTHWKTLSKPPQR